MTTPEATPTLTQAQDGYGAARSEAECATTALAQIHRSADAQMDRCEDQLAAFRGREGGDD